MARIVVQVAGEPKDFYQKVQVSCMYGGEEEVELEEEEDWKEEEVQEEEEEWEIDYVYSYFSLWTNHVRYIFSL